MRKKQHPEKNATPVASQRNRAWSERLLRQLVMADRCVPGGLVMLSDGKPGGVLFLSLATPKQSWSHGSIGVAISGSFTGKRVAAHTTI